VPQAFWDTIQRMQNMAIQPLDLLPPVDVTFEDYALAVLRAEEIANPTDPDDYRGMMLDVFIARGILAESDRAELGVPHHVFDRMDLEVFHDVDTIASSPADAYRFLDDNRDSLFIPRHVDVTVADLCGAQKLTRQARRLPRQVLLQYTWREDVMLEGPQFGSFNGQPASMLCGGTLALNQNGELLAWARKPGSQPAGSGAAGGRAGPGRRPSRGVPRRGGATESIRSHWRCARQRSRTAREERPPPEAAPRRRVAAVRAVAAPRYPRRG
jgi:hypothetical protein